MIYLDYSATTKIDNKIIDRMKEISQIYFANPNSNHDLGIKANELILNDIKNIANHLGIKENEIIFTSGASESNNTAIKGIWEKYDIKHIITTKLEHSSINAPISYLMNKGVKVSFVKLDNGIVDLQDLKNLINNEMTLVSICAVNSETGIREPIEEIGKILNNYENVIFHSDITQCVGKDIIDLSMVDLASFSAHKIYGPIGIGGLIVKEKFKIEPLIHGGKSTSVYRSGTPQTCLIDMLSTSLDLIMPSLKKDIEYIKSLNNKIMSVLKSYEKIHINNNENSIPHIINFSIEGLESDYIQKYFNDKEIYISTKTACATGNGVSTVIYELTKSEMLASSCVRVSISKYTTMEEIEEFLKVLKKLLEVDNESN